METFQVIYKETYTKTIRVLANSHAEAEVLARKEIETLGAVIHMDTVSKVTGEI